MGDARTALLLECMKPTIQKYKSKLKAYRISHDYDLDFKVDPGLDPDKRSEIEKNLMQDVDKVLSDLKNRKLVMGNPSWDDKGDETDPDAYGVDGWKKVEILYTKTTDIAIAMEEPNLDNGKAFTYDKIIHMILNIGGFSNIQEAIFYSQQTLPWLATGYNEMFKSIAQRFTTSEAEINKIKESLEGNNENTEPST